jgi:hypothetical protein
MKEKANIIFGMQYCKIIWYHNVLPVKSKSFYYDMKSVIGREKKIPYILESNPHPFHSFRELKNQMRIRFAI